MRRLCLSINMIHSLRIAGYRSLRDFRLRLGHVTTLRGANGMGKTNVYRALRLLSALARDEFGQTVAQEGGMRSLLWAGNHEHSRLTTLSAEVETDTFTYTFECGLRPSGPEDLTAFKLDPNIKSEHLHFGRRPMAKRNGSQLRIANAKGVMQTSAQTVASSMSMLVAVRDLENFPLQLAACSDLARWRFYHAMRTDPLAPARQPMRGFWSPVLAEDAANLPAVVQSIRESDRREMFDSALASAFPEATLTIDHDDWFTLAWDGGNLPRPFSGLELSDGTLQFLCLAAALCTPQPPPLLVLNEPETSLSEQVLPALAELIAEASQHSQVLIVTHSATLSQAIAERCQTRYYELTMRFGETRLRGQEHSRTSFVIFNDEDDEA
jgi:predicted ATPase